MANERKKFNGDKYERQHSRNLNAIQRKLRKIYETAAEEAANIAMLVGAIGEDEYFHFDNYPITKQRIRELMQELGEQTEAVVVNGVRSEWALANDKNDALCAFVLGNKINLSFEEQRKYFSNNNAAREAFLARAEKGMNLSERVWNYTAGYKNEIEAGLSLGLGKGKDAPALARELKRNLKAPDKLFRRVRDKYGVLRLSKEARNYHPGEGRPGVYRSSYKNALRLAVTETNMAYRTADYQRYQQFDFIVGVEVHLSETNHPVPDICDQLQGRYPKGFKFVGWHPHCRCIVTSILDLSSEPQQIENTPQQFDEWVQDNAKRIKTADKRGTTPYFVRDNRDAVENALKGGKGNDNSGNNNSTIQEATKFGRASDKEFSKLKEDKKFNTPAKLSEEVEKDAKEICAELGIKHKPMTLKEADSGNPNLVRDKENCQSCVVVYEARRRGIDLTALKSKDIPKKIWLDLGNNSGLAFLSKDGTLLTPNKKEGSLDEMVEWFKNETKGIGRYHIGINNGDDGHIIIAERLNKKKIILYDPQRDETLSIQDFLEDSKYVECLRVDELLFNRRILKAISRTLS